MATESVKYVAPETQTSLKTKVFPRPGQHATGIIDWLTTIDHKKIGLMYGLSALFFLLLGGVEALLIRSQLWDHNMEVLTNRQYNQMLRCMEPQWYSSLSCHWCRLLQLHHAPSNRSQRDAFPPHEHPESLVFHWRRYHPQPQLVLQVARLQSAGLAMRLSPTLGLQKSLAIWVLTSGSFLSTTRSCIVACFLQFHHHHYQHGAPGMTMMRLPVLPG